MPEDKDPNLTSGNDLCNMRKDLEEALVIWEELGTALKKLLAISVPDDFSLRELEAKTLDLLITVEALDLKIHRIISEQYFKLSEVSEMLDVEAYVLRYWESEFTILKPSKTRARERLYHKKDIEKLRLIRDLIYGEKFTIAGAKKQLREIEDKTDD